MKLRGFSKNLIIYQIVGFTDRHPYILSGICGVLSVLPFLFPSLWILSWISLVPFFSVLYSGRLSSKASFRCGLARGFVFYFFLYDWLYVLYPMDFAGLTNGESIAVIAAGMLLLPLLHGFEIALAAYLQSKMKFKGFALPLVSACLWTLIEYVQSLGTFGFPWGFFGLSQYKFLPAIQSASLFGPYFISFVIILFNCLFAFSIVSARRGKQKVKLPVFLCAFVFAANTLFGVITMAFPAKEDKQLTVLIIQGNTSSSEKWDSISTVEILEKHIGLAREAADRALTDGKKLDLTVFSETAVPVSLYDSRKNLSGIDLKTKNEYEALSKDYNTYIFTGGFYNDGEQYYNSVFLFTPDGKEYAPYHKRHIVPFGEYLPYRSFAERFFPALTKINAFSSDLTAGTSPAVFHTEKGKIGALVCFDSIFTSLARESVLNGAQMIVLATNDSWYRDSAAVYQHNAHAVFRAVENGRYILRSANTGISSVISEKGEILTCLPPLTDGYIIEDVKTFSGRTLYNRIGNVFPLFCILLILLSVDYQYYFKKKSAD